MKKIMAKMAAGDLVRVFSVARVMHPTVVDLFGLAGKFDGFWIDHEHGGATYEQMHVLSQASRANGFECFVRMAPVGYSAVTQCLEAGTGGVMAAQIHSVEHAQQFVEWSRFPPLGARGLNTGGHDGCYTHLTPSQFVEKANADTFVAIQIETKGALEDVDAIAALEGVDHIFIGPSDLSMAVGVVGQFHSDVLWEAIQRVSQAAARHGKSWGVLPPDPKFADRAVELGCRLLSIANDPLIMKKGIEAFQSTFANSFDATKAVDR